MTRREFLHTTAAAAAAGIAALTVARRPAGAGPREGQAAAFEGHRSEDVHRQPGRHQRLQLCLREDLHGSGHHRAWARARSPARKRPSPRRSTSTSDTWWARDPADIEMHWQAMYRWPRWRGGPILNSAISAVEIALWDILGQALGQPIWKLIGGKARERVQMYVHAGGRHAASSTRRTGCRRRRRAGPAARPDSSPRKETSSTRFARCAKASPI